MLTWQELAKRTAADWVGGKLIAYHEGKHIELAQLSEDGSTVSLTLAGVDLAKSLHPLDRDAEGTPGGSKRKRSKAVDPTVVGEQPVAGQVVEGASQHSVDPNQLTLDLDDGAGAQDAVG